jgi:hypothetical protein
MLVEHARRTPRQSPAHSIPTSSGAELPGCGRMSGGHPITMVQGEHLRFGGRALVGSTGPRCPPWLPCWGLHRPELRLPSSASTPEVPHCGCRAALVGSTGPRFALPGPAASIGLRWPPCFRRALAAGSIAFERITKVRIKGVEAPLSGGPSPYFR